MLKRPRPAPNSITDFPSTMDGLSSKYFPITKLQSQTLLPVLLATSKTTILHSMNENSNKFLKTWIRHRYINVKIRKMGEYNIFIIIRTKIDEENHRPREILPRKTWFISLLWKITKKNLIIFWPRNTVREKYLRILILTKKHLVQSFTIIRISR